MKTNVQLDKDDLLHAFRLNRAAILACARSWPADRVEEVFLGEWCLLDLLAHLSGWDEANREAVTAVQAGRLPEFYAHKDADWRGFNASTSATIAGRRWRRRSRRSSAPSQI